MDSSGWVTVTRGATSTFFVCQLGGLKSCEMVCFADLRAKENCGVHLPHGLLRQHSNRTVGRSDHLQDQEELCLPAGHEVSKTPTITLEMT